MWGQMLLQHTSLVACNWSRWRKVQIEWNSSNLCRTILLCTKCMRLRSPCLLNFILILKWVIFTEVHMYYNHSFRTSIFLRLEKISLSNVTCKDVKIDNLLILPFLSFIHPLFVGVSFRAILMSYETWQR